MVHPSIGSKKAIQPDPPIAQSTVTPGGRKPGKTQIGKATGIYEFNEVIRPPVKAEWTASPFCIRARDYIKVPSNTKRVAHPDIIKAHIIPVRLPSSMSSICFWNAPRTYCSSPLPSVRYPPVLIRLAEVCSARAFSAVGLFERFTDPHKLAF